jgi:hypothetical protein
MRPERLAAASRALQRTLLERLALDADAILDGLARERGMVAWDREQLLGRVQRTLLELREQRFGRPGGALAGVIERAAQPLECIAVVWEQLRRGRPVELCSEPQAFPWGARVLRGMSELLGPEALRVRDEPMNATGGGVEPLGVEPARPRVALVQADADPELAAYVLARVCLRRSGFHPRAVHRAVVEGAPGPLVRHLRRLWEGATMGPTDDDAAFAGPVAPAQARAFAASITRLRGEAGAEALVDGESLEGLDAAAVYLGPALWAIDGAASCDGELAGPILVLHRVPEGEGERALDRLGESAAGRIYVGQPRRGRPLGALDRQYAGALLVERIPPGLPKPRP